MKLSDMFSHWEQVRSDLMQTIDKFSQDELTFTPFDSAWPAGQIMLHIADCEDNWLHGVVRGEFEPWIGYPLEEHPTKADILDVLNAARSRTIPYLQSLDERNLDQKYMVEGEEYTLKWIIWHVLEHEIHHRGELSLILGILGRDGLDV
ncbi:MAG: DinB family protein [Anaerolineales bacterium]|jgi:uncharacterized damage-inducible protein DinB